MDNSHIEKMLESAKKLEEQMAKFKHIHNDSFVAKFLENQKPLIAPEGLVDPKVHRDKAIMAKLDALALGLKIVIDGQRSIFNKITGTEPPELEE